MDDAGLEGYGGGREGVGWREGDGEVPDAGCVSINHVSDEAAGEGYGRGEEGTDGGFTLVSGSCGASHHGFPGEEIGFAFWS